MLSSSSKSLAALLDAQTGEFDHILQIPHQITHVHSLEHGRNDVSGFLMVDAGIPFPESVAVHMFPEYVQLPSEQKTRIWLSDGVSGVPSIRTACVCILFLADECALKHNKVDSPQVIRCFFRCCMYRSTEKVASCPPHFP